MKTATIGLRVTPEDKETIETLATKLGLSTSEFITRLVKNTKDNKEILNSLLPRI